MSKIYTKTGDKGETSLGDGTRVSKRHPRITAFNNVDEVNCAVGVARSLKPALAVDKMLKQIQEDLFVLGSDLATPPGEEKRFTPRIKPEQVRFLERSIDALTDKLPPLKTFILPGGTPLAAHLHTARVLARRAERKIIDVNQEEKLAPEILEYANRLSDFLFVLARYINHEAGVEDTPWIPQKN